MEDGPQTKDDRTRNLGSSENELCYARSTVTVVEGPDRGKQAEASGDDLSIGTSPGNDLLLTDRTVSRHHLKISLSPEAAVMRDLGSTNGTKCNGLRVVEVHLEPGTRMSLGNTIVEFGEPTGVVREQLSESSSFSDLLGVSPAMRRLFSLLPKISASSATVLLSGETGCGKSLIANAIHQESKRADGPFVVVDCGAIPPTLIESELFGHVKGAFTGADRDRAGAFRRAAGGTLLLEEIGELPLDMQPKLLRALEERMVSPVGSDEQYKLDIRVVAATNRDLRERVNTGHFRADLYYRLNVVGLRVPPLRERRDDVALLAKHFYREFTGDDASPHLIATLVARDWPGNVRELRAAVERVVLLGELTEPAAQRPAGNDDPEFDATISFRSAKEHAMTSWERQFLTQLIEAHGGNLSAAARAARMDRNYLRELLIRRGVDYKKK